MAYEIYDTPTSLKLVFDGNTRMLLKQHVREISLVKNNTIQIDLGEGRRVFLPFNNIAVPAMNDPYALIEELNNYVNSYSQYCYEHIINVLELINATGSGGNGNNGYPWWWDGNPYNKTARLFDERNPNVIYKGYSNNSSTNTNDYSWSIERITTQDGIVTHEWADGDMMNFGHGWNERENYNYQ